MTMKSESGKNVLSAKGRGRIGHSHTLYMCQNKWRGKILFLKGRKRKTKELWFMGSNESKQIEKFETDKDNTIIKINGPYLYST